MIDCIKTVSNCIRIMDGVVSSLTIFPEKMKAALTDDMLATDVADYLVKKGVPFRQTHHIAGAVVRVAEEQKTPIASLKIEQLKEISPLFEADIADIFDFESSIEKRTSPGGTCKKSVLDQIESIEAYLAKRQ